MINPNPVILKFRQGTFVAAESSPIPERGDWVYIWVTSNTKKAVYVGETCQRLTVRLRHSIAETSHPTQNQLERNGLMTGLDLSQDFLVYAYQIRIRGNPENAQRATIRKGIESWVHFYICTTLRQHDQHYCGFKYGLPSVDGQGDGAKITNNLAERLRWPYLIELY